MGIIKSVSKTAYISSDFRRDEFACKCGCGFDDIDPELVYVLQNIRDYFCEPVQITSACRCLTHNISVGGSPNSQHPLGTAADIQVRSVDPAAVVIFIESAYPGTYGLGRYKDFTHIDVRLKKSRWGKS